MSGADARLARNESAKSEVRSSDLVAGKVSANYFVKMAGTLTETRSIDVIHVLS